MNNKTTQKETEPLLCQKCFSFYGAPQTQNFCSKCFQQIAKELQQGKQKSQDTQLKETLPLEEPETVEKIVKVIDSSKCNECDKKIGIRGFKCKCEYSFCKKHRIPENHDCNFDFKTFEKNKLSEKNQVCMADKVSKF